MDSKLIVARMNVLSSIIVAKTFAEFDATELPGRTATSRRQLFAYHGLYLHLQDFGTGDGGAVIEAGEGDPGFAGISEDLRPHIAAYNPAARLSSADSVATCFYDWTASS
ncbi:TcmI family type II polyketide cyclase [Streptomyces sp. CAU 1734]|uniref:TcmI family type II polyketide cyclase n=1 Tax=Streptomyces sp. CAU 1734 TaxID=3140360 RepID=UPI003260BF0F